MAGNCVQSVRFLFSFESGAGSCSLREEVEMEVGKRNGLGVQWSGTQKPMEVSLQVPSPPPPGTGPKGELRGAGREKQWVTAGHRACDDRLVGWLGPGGDSKSTGSGLIYVSSCHGPHRDR